MEVLAISEQADNGILEVFYLEVPLCAAVQRLGELQVTYGLCFGSCCFRGWDRGWSSILRNRFHTPRSTLKSRFVA